MLNSNRIFLFILALLTLVAIWVISAQTGEQQDLHAMSKKPVPETAPPVLPDFNQYHDVNEKKQAFFDYMWPLVLQSNQQIWQERQFLLSLKASPSSLSKSDKSRLEQIAQSYQQERESGQSISAWLDTLLLKVDIIPPSLALAQAANESAWGTSRFALEGFNFYGQWCFSPGCGIVPSARVAGATHEVAVFDTPQASVKAYMANLNGFHRYDELRDLRAQKRAQSRVLLGYMLAQGLMSYSERGEHYIDEIQAMIRINQLENYDQAWAKKEINR